MGRPNYQDIAVLAGVGTATVERVLNGRGGVRSELIEKVTMAARTLNYPRILPDAYHKMLRIEVLMVVRKRRFIGACRMHLRLLQQRSTPLCSCTEALQTR
jgi:DNA-binding LacI/PurR family transcriptional regulator